jgi:hypothetical protein
MTKYAVHPGYVTSKTDDDRHFIGAEQLMELYGVSPADCVVIPWDHPAPARLDGRIHLYPRYNGDYEWIRRKENQS